MVNNDCVCEFEAIFLYIMYVNVTLFVGFYFVKSSVVVSIIRKIDMLLLKISKLPANIIIGHDRPDDRP